MDVDDISEETTQIFNSANTSNYQIASVSSSNILILPSTVDAWSPITLVTKTIVRDVDQYSDLAYFIKFLY